MYPQSDRAVESTLHAIQTWVALPEDREEIEPSFHHYAEEQIPISNEKGVEVTLVAGEAKGRIFLKTLSPTIYLDLVFTPEARFALSDRDVERAIYSVTPGISIDSEALEQHRLAIVIIGKKIELSANTEARCIVIGGTPLGKRYKWWNFVSSNPARIEQAKADWQAGRFPQVLEEAEEPQSLS